jgi:hypothetical protein
VLPPHVLDAHVDVALEAEARADRRRGHAVLARARLGDDAALAQAAGQDGLAERVVELVRTRVQEILALEPEPLAGREALRKRQRSRPPAVRAAELVQLRVEERVVERRAPARRELVERRDQRLGDVAAPVLAVPLRHRAAST